MEKEENLDLLDLEDSGEVDTLPEAEPFSTSRPKKPWLLMGLGLAIIVLATWIIVAKIGTGSNNDVSVDLIMPLEKVEDIQQGPVEQINVPVKPVEVAPQPVVAPVTEKPVVEQKTVAEQPKEIVEKPAVESTSPVRVIDDRKEVTFNPDKGNVKSSETKASVKKTTKTVTSAPSAGFYVQFGSYSTRELAQAAERKMRTSHTSLFSGKQFVILSANVKGQTKYRLRVAFNTAGEADGFCKNAKSDGLDCYVTK